MTHTLTNYTPRDLGAALASAVTQRNHTRAQAIRAEIKRRLRA